MTKRAASGRRVPCGKKGCWEGACGTGKQQVPGEYPRDNISEDFMAVKQTGNSLREERVLGGRLRYWNRRNTHA